MAPDIIMKSVIHFSSVAVPEIKYRLHLTFLAERTEHPETLLTLRPRFIPFSWWLEAVHYHYVYTVACLNTQLWVSGGNSVLIKTPLMSKAFDNFS